MDSPTIGWPDVVPKSGYRWLHLDLNDPGLKDWAEEHLPNVSAMALMQSETRPWCGQHNDGLILNFRAINLNPESDPEDMVSLRMWVAKNSIVSARVRNVWPVDAIRQAAEGGTAQPTVGRFFNDLAHALVNRIESVTLELEEETDKLEEEVFGDGTSSMDNLGSIGVAVIKMRRFLNPQREAIARLAALDDWTITPEELALLGETSNRTRRIVEEPDATRDRLTALQDYLLAQQHLSQARSSYILSVVAAIFLPMVFLTGLFGVNVAGMPGTASPWAFLILTLASVIVGIELYAAFRIEKWLWSTKHRVFRQVAPSPRFCSDRPFCCLQAVSTG